MKTLLLTLALVLTSLAANAGGIGNGGFILECKENGKMTYKLYDYEEFRPKGFPQAAVFPGMVPDLGGPNMKTRARIDYVLNRLAKVNPTRAQIYRELAKNFFVDQEPLEVGHEFIKVADLGAAQKPKNCELKQLVQQRNQTEKVMDQKTFLVDTELFRKIEAAGFTEVTAGIVLHESIYFESLNSNNEPSKYSFIQSPVYVRYYNAVISSRNMNKITQAEYLAFMLDEVSGKNPGRNRLTSYLDFNGVPVFSNRSFTRKLDVRGGHQDLIPVVTTKAKFLCSSVELHPNGEISSCYGNGTFTDFSINASVPMPTFHDNGSLKAIAFAEEKMVPAVGLKATSGKGKVLISGLILNRYGVVVAHSFQSDNVAMPPRIDLGFGDVGVYYGRFDERAPKYASFAVYGHIDIGGKPHDVSYVSAIGDNFFTSPYRLISISENGTDKCLFLNTETKEMRSCTPSETSVLEYESKKLN